MGNRINSPARAEVNLFSVAVESSIPGGSQLPENVDLDDGRDVARDEVREDLLEGQLEEELLASAPRSKKHKKDRRKKGLNAEPSRSAQ